MLELGQQTIKIHLLLTNISGSKSNQTMEFGEVIEVTRKILLFKNYAEDETRKLVPDFFLFFKKALHEVKAIALCLSFNIFW